MVALAKYVRPQKHNSWFNVLPERDFAGLVTSRMPFLDSFVTVEKIAEAPGYSVRYEGAKPLQVTLQFGFICVWFGDNLDTPDWAFPTLFDRSFGHDYFVSQPRIFKNTNLLDLIENNGDKLHFKTVHQWLSVRIWDHEYTDRVFRLKMKGRIRYARAADSSAKRKLARLLPSATYSQELAFHGPGFGAGVISTGVGLKANLVLAFTPTGTKDLKLHMAASVDKQFIPRPLRALADRYPGRSLHDTLAWGITKAGIDDTDGDYRIWRHKRSLKAPKLLAGEIDIVKIRNWMAQFYLKDFKQPQQASRTPTRGRWFPLGGRAAITPGEVHPFTVDGEELVALQADGGQLRVFEAHCPHQGAHLGYGGELHGDCVACPFHRFHFNPEGQFVGTRPRGKVRPQMKLKLIEHRVAGDLVEVLL